MDIFNNRIFTYQLSANGASISVGYTTAALMVAVRGTRIGLYVFDNWNSYTALAEADGLEVSCASKTITVTNNNSVALNLIFVQPVSVSSISTTANGLNVMKAGEPEEDA